MSLSPTQGASAWRVSGAPLAADQCYRKVVTFAAHRYELLEPGTPVYKSSNEWHRWSGGDQIHGFVISAPVQTSDTETVQALVMLRGMLRYEEVVLFAGESETVLKAALRDGLRELGLRIQGLTADDVPAIDDTVANGGKVILPMIASAAAVYTPVVSTTYALALPHVSSGAVVYDPTVTLD